jgi:hypothetical protein
VKTLGASCDITYISLVDRATIPAKNDDIHMTDAEKNTKKLLNFKDWHSNSSGVLALTYSTHIDVRV